MANLQRDINVSFRVTEDERELIRQKMELAQIRSLRAYMTKMAIDGYVIQLDLSELREMVSLLGNATNNINQIAKRVNETGSIYEQDIADLQAGYDGLWQQVKQVLRQVSQMKK